jgi:hypothetical protein
MTIFLVFFYENWTIVTVSVPKQIISFYLIYIHIIFREYRRAYEKLNLKLLSQVNVINE